MSACEVCKSIDLSKIIENYKFSVSPRGRSQLPIGWLHHTSYSDLRASAASCPSCAIFFQESNADPRYPNKPPIKEDDCVKLFAITGDGWPRRYKNNSANGVFLLRLDVMVGSRTVNNVSYNKWVDVWIKDDSPPSLKNLVLPRPTGPVGDPSLIRQWLTDCVANHSSCKVKVGGLEGLLTGEMVTLPTRVINVGCSDGTQEPQLLETNGLKGVYLALSHCWGNGQVTRTEQSTLNSHKTCIPLAELPKNFRDAIIVTRRLGFQYLWIDSLCIIQDSAEDWDIESSRMAQIYNHSTLTISAANSSNADEGFLQTRIPLEDRSAKIPWSSQRDAADGSFYICELLSDFDNDVERGPLHKRGWTLQERILSRRNVFFGQDQLHWECRTVKLSENTRLAEQEFMDVAGGISSLRGLSSLQANDFANIFKLWYALVAEYTKRALTKGGDKLPALSGIVKVMNEVIYEGQGNSYIAGLWRQDLPRGLFWKSFGRERAHQIKVRAPSWSWISHDGRIESGREMSPSTADITDVAFDIGLTGLDPFGRVDDGKITFTGYIKAVPTVSRCGPDFQDLDEKQVYVYTNAILKDGGGQHIGAAVLDEPNKGLDRTVFCVPIRHPGTVMLAHAPRIDVLLLCQVPGESMVYTRIGVAEMNATAAQAALSPVPFQAFLSGAEKRRITIT